MLVLLFWTWFSAAAIIEHHHERSGRTSIVAQETACVTCQWLHGVRTTLLATKPELDTQSVSERFLLQPCAAPDTASRIHLQPRAPPA